LAIYSTPGVYRVPALEPPPDLRAVRTDIAGFAGFTERGPVAQAVKLNSWNDYRLVFGGFLADSYLAYGVRAFFSNGGVTCYVARVAAVASPPSFAALPLPAPNQAALITFLAADVTHGDAQVTLESSAVVNVGDILSIGAPDTGERLAVVAVVDDQTIQVAPVPESNHFAGDDVYHVTGSPLGQAAGSGQTVLTVVDATPFHAGDLVSIEGAGISELRVIASVSGSALGIALPLAFDYQAGNIVRRFQGALTVQAASAGEWGNRISLSVQPLQSGTSVTEFSLRVTVDATKDRGQPIEQEFYPHLSLDPATRAQATPLYAPDVVNAASQLIQLQVTGAPLMFVSGPLESGDLYLQGGGDGVARAAIRTTDFLNALDTLANVDDIAILCCPDAVAQPIHALPQPQPPVVDPCTGAVAIPPATAPPPAPASWSTAAIQIAMLEQCLQLRYRVAVLDPPMGLQPAAMLNWLNSQSFNSLSAKFGAVYFPWLRVPDELNLSGPNRTVPASGHAAGTYAYTDINFGVQKPPANVELDYIADVEIEVTNQQQGFLNERGINVIRPFPGRGIRVWGGRSISQDPAWRFIHTRRLLSMIEDSTEKASQWTVFEVNNDDLRRTLTHSLNVFLETIWREGALKGTRPEYSYFVKCDGTNNPQSSIDAGLLVCQVGVAIAAPMEFILFEMRRSVAGPQIVEA
jgi:hypothetical protein